MTVTHVLADPYLFNSEDFAARLASSPRPLQVYKDTLSQGDEYLQQRFSMGASPHTLVHQRAWLLDQVLMRAWYENTLDDCDLALIAVGGYGRGELLPGSDIDITIVVKQTLDDSTRQSLEAFLTFLWDIGMEVGHSVRTLDQCVSEAKADITIATSLMEARWLAGDQSMFREMMELTGPDRIWPNREFFKAKLGEQARRHHKFDDTAYNLEPNIKEGPGGLRDIQMVGWVAKRYFGATTLRELVGHGFLTEDEFLTLDAGQNFLWRIRFALHNATGRREDRLLFEHQRRLGRMFGYSDEDEQQQLGVERFMKAYYLTVMELSRLNEMLLQLFQEAILYPDAGTIKPLNKRFQVRTGFIEVCHDNIFERYPFALLEIFLLIQQHPKIRGVRASTIRLIRNHRQLIDDAFRADLRNRSLFMEIIRQPRRLGHELERMHRYGVLGCYLPQFAAVTGLMQFDLFHIYTVDEHTLKVVHYLRRLSSPKQTKKHPYSAAIMQQLPKPELLYLGGLFHDIGKGQGGHHERIGAVEALRFCRRHSLSLYDSKLVAWLVKNHLIMSSVSQRQDISDPEVINRFAQTVGDRTHLDYIYLLTLCDIRGTNPDLWNSWKDSLLTELHRNTYRALRRGLGNPIDAQELIAETKGEALAMLCTKPLDKQDILNLWKQFGDEYFLRHQADEIAWQTESIVSASEDDLPLVLIRTRTQRGSSEIFTYSRDLDYLFSATTITLDQLGLTILDARIITTGYDHTLSTYMVLDAATNKVIEGDDRADEIIARLRAQIFSQDTLTMSVNRAPSRKLKSFPVPPTVNFTTDTGSDRTMMEVTSMDQPGFLAMVGLAMRNCEVRIQNARIATIGERADDVFYITDMDHQPIPDAHKLACLRESIIQALKPDTLP